MRACSRRYTATNLAKVAEYPRLLLARQPSAERQASPVFLRHLLDHRVVQHGVRQQPLPPAVLVLKYLSLASLRHTFVIVSSIESLCQYFYISVFSMSVITFTINIYPITYNILH